MLNKSCIWCYLYNTLTLLVTCQKEGCRATELQDSITGYWHQPMTVLETTREEEIKITFLPHCDSWLWALILMFWKSSAFYNAVPVVTGTCMDNSTRVYYTWGGGSFHVWVSFTPKVFEAFWSREKMQFSIYSCLQKGIESKDSEVWLGWTPRSWDSYLKLLHVQIWAGSTEDRRCHDISILPSAV